MTRKQKATLNIITSFLLEVINIINSLILPRLILLNFGSAYNGITSSATQFFSLISILTLGVTLSTRVALYKPLADNNIEAISSVVKATEKYMQKVGMVLATYIIALAFIYPITINTGFGFYEVSSLILIVGMSAFAEYFFGITYRTFLLADQSIYIVNIFSIVSVIVNLVLTYVLIMMGFSIQIVKLGSAIVFVFKPVLQNIYVKRKYKIISKCEPDMSALTKRGDAMMHSIANIIHDNTDLIVLTLFTHVKVVSVYTVYNLVVSSLKRLQNIFTNGTEPIFGDMWVKGEVKGIKEYLGLFEFFIAIFSGITYSVTYIMILPFISLYTKGVTDINYIRPFYSAIIIVAFIILSFRTPYVAVIYGIGHFKETRNAAIIEAILNIIISVALVLFINDLDNKIIGVAIGTLVANLYRTMQYALYIDKKIVHRGKRVFLGKIIWTFLNMFVIVSITQSLMNILSIEITSWFSWIINAILCTILSIAFTGISAVVFYRNDLIKTLGIAKQMLLKKNPLKKH